ncbi:MAG: Formamidopyrimidine-DNA glycosylase [uncultured Acidimicrobiales bacterium]|uniref:DNA-(apurinic or apyrimidinic site) lyase n=1 Tax=uncultured Acidimicrobiales bacterium TaxID=310071 RepID=A0A6J4HSD3_9ACTN|nr:MAG: Formamidopyrimidine-DNA glycosylase [uncultured Acidimicrobiales bacterium]
MPEGDTIFRTGTSLRRWLEGREVTAGRGAGLERVVGATVAAIETRGKHLLIRFSSGFVLHSHMRMSGSWHVYPRGGPWQRPAAQARAVLECGDRVAVCFNAPVVELLRDHEERVHRTLTRLGPDVLASTFDLDEVVRRADGRPATMAVGELLLDQGVVAGLGNVYRCEALFLERLDPWAPRALVGADEVRRLVTLAQQLIRANARMEGPPGRDVGSGPARLYVHGRTGRPCRRCATTIHSARLGFQARSVFWCPTCQPARRSKLDGPA